MRDITSSFTLALGDIFSPRVLLVSLFSLCVTLLFFTVLIWAAFGGIGALSLWITQWLQSMEGGLEQSWLFQLVSLFVITKTIIGILLFFTSAFVVYYLFLMVYSIVVGLFSSYFINEIGRIYYPDVAFRGMPLLSYLAILGKTLLITALLFLVLSPVAFVPLLNMILLIPVFYMFHKLLVLDVSSMLHSKEEYMRLKQYHSGKMRVTSLLCFGLTLVPLFGVILYPYYVIVMSHLLMQKTRELRAGN